MKKPLTIVMVGLGVLVLITPLPAFAGVQHFFGTIILWIAQFLGQITLTLIGLLVEMVQYNDFINAPAVVKGWVVVRDVVNMLFIVILLAISFGTMFRMEEYQYKHHLGKLLTMAVLVNFSKGIAGFFIDVAQVMMLTFVNGFKEAAAGNFINGFHLDQMFQFAEQANPEQVADESVFLYASLLALITIAVSMVVIAVYLIVVLVRIIALWILIIVSPLAFLANAWPGKGHEYHEEWWQYFGKYVSTGPILAFFLWLSLAVMQFSDSVLGDFSIKNSDLSIPAAAITGIGQSEILLSFLVSIILLIAGLWITAHAGIIGGGIAVAGIAAMRKAGSIPTSGLAKFGRRRAAGLGGWGVKRLDDAQARLQQRFMKSGLGQRLAKSKVGEALAIGKIAERGVQIRTLPQAWRERSHRKERERLGEASGVAEDIMSRGLSLGKDKTNKSLEMRQKLVQEELKEITTVSEDQEFLLHEYEESTEGYTTGDGRKVRRAIHGKEAKVEAILLTLAKNHDPNEIFKSERLGKPYGMVYTPQKVIELLKDLYGNGSENDEVARVAFKLQEVGLGNNDGLLKGIARVHHGKFVIANYFEDTVHEKQKQSGRNPDGSYRMSEHDAEHEVIHEHRARIQMELQNRHALEQFNAAYVNITPDQRATIDTTVNNELNQISDQQIQERFNAVKQGEVAAAFMAKRTGRTIVNQARFQDSFAEVADANGNRAAGAFNEVGQANLKVNGAAMAAHYNFLNEETKKYYGQNLDLIVKYFEENYDQLNDTEKENFRYFISAVVQGSNILKDADLIGADDIRRFITQYGDERQVTMENIIRNRRADNLPDVEGATIPTDSPLYNVKRDDIHGPHAGAR